MISLCPIKLDTMQFLCPIGKTPYRVHADRFALKATFPMLRTPCNTPCNTRDSANPIGLIINTSCQKLPFGAGDYPDKLLYHQALKLSF